MATTDRSAPAPALRSDVTERSLIPPAPELWSGMIPQSVTVSPEGAAVAFVQALADGQCVGLARGGKLDVSARYDAIGEGLVFSPDGRRLAFVGGRRGRRPAQHVVVD